ncbi:MAG: hypothetical protein ACTSU5_09120, partial [Promethearchaeota archaeon]
VYTTAKEVRTYFTEVETTTGKNYTRDDLTLVDDDYFHINIDTTSCNLTVFVDWIGEVCDARLVIYDPSGSGVLAEKSGQMNPLVVKYTPGTYVDLFIALRPQASCCSDYKMVVSVDCSSESEPPPDFFESPGFSDIPPGWTPPDVVNNLVLGPGNNQGSSVQAGGVTMTATFDLTAPVNLTLGLWNQNPSGTDPGMASGSSVIYFQIHVNDTNAVTFPIEVTFTFPDWVTSDMTADQIASAVRIVTWNNATNSWSEQTFTVSADLNTRTITVKVTHLSVFSLGQGSGGSSDDLLSLDIPGYSAWVVLAASAGTVLYVAKKQWRRGRRPS